MRARLSGPSSFGILESPEGELVEGVGQENVPTRDTNRTHLSE